MKIKFIILANERADDHLLWIQACEKYWEKNSFRIVNLTGDNWLEEIRSEPFDVLLAKPGGVTSGFKQLYDERIYILGKVLQYTVYPSPEEIFIYENKRFLSFWLAANEFPHPATHVFYNQAEAKQFLKSSSYPVIGKVNIGASGSGVSILKGKNGAIKYLKQIFSDKGAGRRHGPNLNIGGWGHRAFSYLKNSFSCTQRLNYIKLLAGICKRIL